MGQQEVQRQRPAGYASRGLPRIELVVQVMKVVNDLIKVPELNQTMQQMSKEMMKAGLIEETMSEMLDDAFDTDDIEEDADAEVDKVLASFLFTIFATVHSIYLQQLYCVLYDVPRWSHLQIEGAGKVHPEVWLAQHLQPAMFAHFLLLPVNVTLATCQFSIKGQESGAQLNRVTHYAIPNVAQQRGEEQEHKSIERRCGICVTLASIILATEFPAIMSLCIRCSREPSETCL